MKIASQRKALMGQDIATLVLKKPAYKKLDYPSFGTNLMEEVTVRNKFFKHIIDGLINNNRPASRRNICCPVCVFVNTIKWYTGRRLPCLSCFPTTLGVNPKSFSYLVRVN